MKKAAIIIINGILLYSCNSKEEVNPIKKDIKELIFASGQIEWDNSYNLTAQTDGVLLSADFEVGDVVQKGGIIAKIDNELNAVNLETSQKQIAITNENISLNSPALIQVEQNIQLAESKYLQDKKQAERYERLNKQNIGSRVEYENAQLNAKSALINLTNLKKQYAVILQQAKQQHIATSSQLKSNKIIKKYNSIEITENGTIIKKLKSNGDYIRKGEVIAVIADAKKTEAVLNIDENSIDKIKKGQPVFIKLNSNKNKVYTGRISEILATFDNQSQSFICKVVFENPIQNSIFGTQLEANILVGEKKNALLIPRNYIGFGNKVRIKGKDENVVVKTGIISTEYVEILNGISENSILLPLNQ